MASIGIGIGIEDLILQVLVLVLNFGNCQVLVLVLTLGSSEVLVLVLVSEKWYCPSLIYSIVKLNGDTAITFKFDKEPLFP